MLIILTVVIPFAMFLGGAYLLHYPVTLGLLYAFNMVLVYLVLWAAANQITKIYTQRIEIQAHKLVLLRDQLYTSFPILRKSDIEISIENVKNIALTQTSIGYLLTVLFEEENKQMGIDLDINPLRTENVDTLKEVLGQIPSLQINQTTTDILDNYQKKTMTWRGNYIFSLTVLGVALGIFLIISIFLGLRVQ